MFSVTNCDERHLGRVFLLISLFTLAKLGTAKAELRIKMFTLDLWAWCPFVYAEVATPYFSRVWNVEQW